MMALELICLSEAAQSELMRGQLHTWLSIAAMYEGGLASTFS